MLISPYSMLSCIRTLLLSILAVAAISVTAPVAGNIVFANHLECSNGLDDDNDGRTDFPEDPDCTSNDDPSESPDGQTTSVDNSSSAAEPVQNSLFQVSVSDERDAAVPGDVLTYTLTVQNSTAQQVTTDINLRVSEFIDISIITPPTPSDASMIVWNNVSFAPNEAKTFAFTGIVRAGTPEASTVSTQVNVGTSSAVDITTIQPASGGAASSVASSDASSSSAESVVVVDSTMLFTKTAGTQEAIPGGTIEYTIMVKNIFGEPLTDAVVNDRYNPTLLIVADNGGANVINPGQLQWNVPTLNPGQVWEKTYTFRVASDSTNSARITNVATISGRGVATAPVANRITTHTMNVVSSLPATGAAFDALFLLMTFPTAAAAAAVQRKLRA